jgi:transcriptional regulator with XRE-family HTH domain
MYTYAMQAGTQTPSIHVISAIANVLGTSVSYLLGETGSEASNFVIISEK